MGESAYSRERLAEAARGARTLSEALVRLGVDPESSTRRYVLGRMKKLGVDVSHFQREGVRWTREVLQEAVTASTNMCEVLRHLGLEVVGGHHTHISRRIKAYGIDISHFQMPTRKGKPRRPRSPEGLLVEQSPADARRIPSDRLKWAMAAVGAPKRCALCDNDGIWHGRPIPLEVDHIDGDWRNNRVENLRLLCPNCHSVTDTYRGRGKGRASR
ncbi:MULTISPECIES: HNH endonuclease signature motif containing protein [Streptomyces]|uniref:HNH endonuclease signature motif containing protein n=1 Tax=Streptomyces TaxID=1883 RepID=UPI0004BFC208|nr:MULTISPECIES: HNH endonuclease signature motif containing protein [unclassified Streptomyces]KOT94182.1 HNH endonuclease [Streptomyces sp. NRRL F-4711]NEB64614.1 HNH endonuclease [Streptomyces diastaticus]